MTVDIRTFVTGPLMVNTFVVSSCGHCWIVDPGEGCSDVVDHIRSHQLQPDAILLTHPHIDHIAGIPELKAVFEGIDLICSAADAPGLDDPGVNLSVMLAPYWSSNVISSSSGTRPTHFTAPSTTRAGVEMTPKRMMSATALTFSRS